MIILQVMTDHELMISGKGLSGLSTICL